MQLNDKVLTDHGTGVVVGWEAFDKEGHTIELSKVDNGNRVAVKLDVGHSWCFDGLYYDRPAALKKI